MTSPARAYPWFSISRLLGLIALLLVILVVVVPGTPDWLLAAAVALVAVGLLFV